MRTNTQNISWGAAGGRQKLHIILTSLPSLSRKYTNASKQVLHFLAANSWQPWSRVRLEQSFAGILYVFRGKLYFIMRLLVCHADDTGIFQKIPASLEQCANVSFTHWILSFSHGTSPSVHLLSFYVCEWANLSSSFFNVDMGSCGSGSPSTRR